MTPIAEMRIPVVLGDRDYVMCFNANTMVSFERETGKFFMDTVSKLYDLMFPKGHLDNKGSIVPVKVSGLDIVRKISMEELRALLWSSLHDYDERDNPVWPLTINQVGRLLNFQNVIPLFMKFLTGVSSNSPTKDELGESVVTASVTVLPDAVTANEAPSSATSGGEVGIRLPADALA